MSAQSEALPLNTDLVFDMLRKVIAGHGAAEWHKEGAKIVIRRAIDPKGGVWYATFHYSQGQRVWVSQPSQSLAVVFACMPSAPARIYTATHVPCPPASGRMPRYGEKKAA